MTHRNTTTKRTSARISCKLFFCSSALALTACSYNVDESCVLETDKLKQTEIVESIVSAYSKTTSKSYAKQRIDWELKNTNVSYYDCAAHFRMVVATGKTPTGYVLEDGFMYELEKQTQELILWAE